MHWPYTLDFADSFFAAQSCAGLMLTALVLFWRFGAGAARGLVLLAIWTAVVASAVAPFAAAIDYRPPPETLRYVLLFSATLGTLGSVLAMRPGVALVALAGEAPLWFVDGFVKDSDGEICALHLAWVGLLVGLLARKRVPRTLEPAPARDAAPSYWTDDVVAFVAGTALAAAVCLFVMRRREGGADEWGYTYQAAVFAKGHLYAQSPRCQPYLQNFYVFESSGRLFSQYTPGWPLFIAPFVPLHAVWLSGPVTMGMFVSGAARLSRSAMRGFGSRDEPPSERLVRAAGLAGGLLALLGTTILVNAASRYAHVFTIALYAWSLEALMQVTAPGADPRRQRRWGALLGISACWMLAARPADGAFLGLGVALVFLYALARRRVGWRALAAAALTFGLGSALVLVVLRVQLGRWFTTGYSLNAVIHPWNVVKYSMPQPHQWKYGLPLATGAYCWWPCSMALGLAGLAMVRGRALSLVAAMALGCLPYVVYCMWLDVGQRGFDWGYGPRYLMPLVVPMAVGGGMALAPLAVAARRETTSGASALARGGPWALALFAIASGWIRIVPLVWPTIEQHTHRHAALETAIHKMHLDHAVVVAKPGTTGFDALDLTTNLPIDLYPDQDVIIAIEKTPDAASCLRAAFPQRRLYSASGTDDVRITPY